MRVCMGKGPYIWGDKERSTCIHTYKFVESAPNVYVCLQTCVVNICLHVFMVLQENICMYFHQNWRFQHALMHVHFHETSWGPGRFCWYSITSCIAWQREAGKVAVMQWEHERPETGKNGSSAQAVHPWKSTLGIANSGSTWKDVCDSRAKDWWTKQFNCIIAPEIQVLLSAELRPAVPEFWMGEDVGYRTGFLADWQTEDSVVYSDR